MSVIPFEVQIVHAVEMIGQADWDELSGNRPFASYRWYRFAETVMSDCRPTYLVLSLHGKAIARATFWTVSNEPIPLPKFFRLPIEAYLRRHPLLICRTPLANRSGLILPEGELYQAALDTIAASALSIAREENATFLTFDFLHETEVSLFPREYTPVTVSQPPMYMRIQWKSFEEYLGTTNKHGRQHYKRTVREASKLGIQITRHAHVTEMEEAERLIRSVDIRKDSSPNPWMRSLHRHMDMVNSVWLAARVDGRLVGCGLALEDNGAHMTTLLGLDENVPYTYFMLTYEDIRLAIETGAHTLYWGSGAEDVKSRLGFTKEDNNHALFTASSLPVKVLIKTLGKVLL